MTFAVRNLSVLAYASGFTLWHYKIGNANLGDCRAHWYFNDASDMFSAGDMILVSGTDGGTILVVAQASHGVIVAPMTP